MTLYDATTGDTLDDAELTARYEDSLDDAFGDVELIGCISVSHARALKEIDPIAYRTGFSDWESAYIEEGDAVERGFWVDVIKDGEHVDGAEPSWHIEEDDAREMFDLHVRELNRHPESNGMSARLYDTAGDILASQHLTGPDVPALVKRAREALDAIEENENDTMWIATSEIEEFNTASYELMVVLYARDSN